MRLITIDEYVPQTMQLAKPIYDKYRRVLLAAGRSIHPVYLKKLEDMDINYLFVEDKVSFGITLEEMMDMPTWMDTIEIVQSAYEAVKAKKDLPIRELQRLVVKLVDEVSKRKAIILIPTTSLAEDLREYAHSVNVALLSLQIAKKLHNNQLQIKDLALGALLHDIGKVINNDEFEHTLAGFDLLRKVREISLLSAHVAFQHHEFYDGNGKPRGMIKDQIHEFAQICSIANFYDNLISKEGFRPHEALEFIMTKSGSMFRADIVKLFVQEVPAYIPGTKVRLNTGEEAMVIKIKSNIQRPVVRVMDSGKIISLEETYTVLISEVLQNEKANIDDLLDEN